MFFLLYYYKIYLKNENNIKDIANGIILLELIGLELPKPYLYIILLYISSLTIVFLTDLALSFDDLML